MEAFTGTTDTDIIIISLLNYQDIKNLTINHHLYQLIKKWTKTKLYYIKEKIKQDLMLIHKLGTDGLIFNYHNPTNIKTPLFLTTTPDSYYQIMKDLYFVDESIWLEPHQKHDIFRIAICTRDSRYKIVYQLKILNEHYNYYFSGTKSQIYEFLLHCYYDNLFKL